MFHSFQLDAAYMTLTARLFDLFAKLIDGDVVFVGDAEECLSCDRNVITLFRHSYFIAACACHTVYNTLEVQTTHRVLFNRDLD